MKKRVAIIIPIYKEKQNTYEHVSMLQLSKILFKYDSFIVSPETLDLAEYLQYNFMNRTFPTKYFQDIHGYNNLLTSVCFYETFSEYEYILIAQPDSFVFTDKLEYWCEQNYDYIGAPWIFNISDYQYLTPYLKFLHKNQKFLKVFIRNLLGRNFLVGNGGFSLRKISTHLKVLQRYEYQIKDYNHNVKKLLENGINTADNEDAFWALFIPFINKDFKIPTYKKALHFSFETNPSFCYQQNKHQLPFGCHAWEKHDLQFWRPIFREYGYII